MDRIILLIHIGPSLIHPMRERERVISLRTLSKSVDLHGVHLENIKFGEIGEYLGDMT